MLNISPFLSSEHHEETRLPSEKRPEACQAWLFSCGADEWEEGRPGCGGGGLSEHGRECQGLLRNTGSQIYGQITACVPTSDIEDIEGDLADNGQ